MRTILIFFLCFCLPSLGQKSKDLKKFQHHLVITKNDTINYHTFSHKGIDSINTILLYLQGSKAMSLYQKMEEDGKIYIGTTLPFDFKLLPDNYLFVVISKKGFPFLTKMDEEFPIPEVYYKNQTLDYRVFQADNVINDLLVKNKNHFDKIIALGHSEGSDVVAKLGTVNKKISHFGYWSGGGNTQFIDFVTFIRKEADKGQISEEKAQVEIEELFKDLKDIMDDPNAVDKFWSGKTNSYNRWSHFSEPPIDNLIQIEKPLFVAIGSKDQAVPIESAYLIPIEFIRKKKENLTFKVYSDLDHGFGKELEDNKYEKHWNDVFKDFLNWLNN